MNRALRCARHSPAALPLLRASTCLEPETSSVLPSLYPHSARVCPAGEATRRRAAARVDGHLATIEALLTRAEGLGSTVEDIIQPLLVHEAPQAAGSQAAADAAVANAVPAQVVDAAPALAAHQAGAGQDQVEHQAEGTGSTDSGPPAAASGRGPGSIAWISDLLFEHKGPTSPRTPQPAPEPRQPVAPAAAAAQEAESAPTSALEVDVDAAASQAASDVPASSAAPEEPAEPVPPAVGLAASAGSEAAPAAEEVEQQEHKAPAEADSQSDESSPAVLPAGAQTLRAWISACRPQPSS